MANMTWLQKSAVGNLSKGLDPCESAKDYFRKIRPCKSGRTSSTESSSSDNEDEETSGGSPY